MLGRALEFIDPRPRLPSLPALGASALQVPRSVTQSLVPAWLRGARTGAHTEGERESDEESVNGSESESESGSEGERTDAASAREAQWGSSAHRAVARTSSARARRARAQRRTPAALPEWGSLHVDERHHTFLSGGSTPDELEPLLESLERLVMSRSLGAAPDPPLRVVNGRASGSAVGTRRRRQRTSVGETIVISVLPRPRDQPGDGDTNPESGTWWWWPPNPDAVCLAGRLLHCVAHLRHSSCPASRAPARVKSCRAPFVRCPEPPGPAFGAPCSSSIALFNYGSAHVLQVLGVPGRAFRHSASKHARLVRRLRGCSEEYCAG